MFNKHGIQSILKLCFIRSVQPSQLLSAIENFIIDNLGQQFIEFPHFELDKCYNDSNYSIPLLFILPGADPLVPLMKFAEKYSKQDSIKTISMGQG